MSNIEEKLGLKKSQLIALIVILALNAYWLISHFIVFGSKLAVETCICFFMLIIAIIYTVYDYKKPHGNLMRYLLLLYVLFSIVLMLTDETIRPTYINVMYLANITLVTYMAGRLDHYKQNVIICGIVLVCKVVVAYHLINMLIGFGMPMNLTNFGCCIGSVSVWLAIASGYIIRYQLHKEAGLENK